MTNIEPFGNSSGSGNFGVQEFCGALVSSFNCSSDFASQGGSLTASLVEDDVNGYKFNVPVVGAPTGFLIQDTDGNTVFEFYGIFDSITRNAGQGGKTYDVAVSSPLKILSAVTLITDTYTGYGSAVEGLPQHFSADGYYNITDSPDGYLPDGVSKIPSGDYYQVDSLQFGTNNNNLNYTGMWANQYNIINVFGAFENDSVGIVNFRGFGSSASSDDGMTLDRVCYALDELINKTGSSEAQRYLGGNILFGTNTYNVCSTAGGYTAPFPYYYGFDAIGFYNQVVGYLGPGYRIKGPLSLLDMVTQICEEINADFLVNLDLVSYTSGDLTSYDNTTYSVYSAGQFTLSQTYTNSLLGGVIWIQVVPRNTYVNCDRPFSDIAYNLIGLEVPNFGAYGTDTEIHPGIQPTGYIDPLDDDYTDVGTRGSPPYGGKFPVEVSGDSTGSALSYHLNRASNTTVSIKANDNTTAKMVVGGYQTRMVNVPRDYIYQYWGDIKIQTSGISNCTGLSRSSDKTIPVITQLLPPNDILDVVMVDVVDILPRDVDVWNPEYWGREIDAAGDFELVKRKYSGKENVTVIPFSSGIYFASVAEIRAAMQSIDEWYNYMEAIKPQKFTVLNAFFEGYSESVNDQALQILNEALKQPTKLMTRVYNVKKQNKNAVYTGFKQAVAFDTKLEPQEALESEEFLDLLAQKLKIIGDEHYGRSWYVPMPFFTTKITENNDTLLGDYIRSWDITDSAYVEPSLFYTIDAPFDSKFISDGKLLPFVNFEYYMSGNSMGYDIFTDSVFGFDIGGEAKFDFSEFSLDSIVIDNSGCYDQPMVHTSPNNISNRYEFIPCNYFTVYNRYNAPFFELTIAGTIADPNGVPRVSGLIGSTYAYSSILRTGVMPIGALNSCGTSAGLLGSTFNDGARASGLVTSGVMANGHNNYYIQYPTQVNANFAANVLNLQFSDNGLNALPFAKVQTGRVLYPVTKDSGISVNDKDFGITLALLAEAKDENGDPLDQQTINQYLNGNTLVRERSKFNKDFDLFPPILPPRSICLPQISNRFVYGPWMTNYTVLYCGKAEFEVNDNLRPENYIIPAYGSLTLAGGTFSSGVSSQTSGFAGMNIAGQAIANSIDNFSLFAQEEGTLVIPGLPLISRIGQNLLSGPRITDISVSINNNEITTTYNFRQQSPRLGRTNREVVKLLSKISKTIKR